MAQELDTQRLRPLRRGAARRCNPLGKARDPAMGRLAALPIGALALFAAGHDRVERLRTERMIGQAGVR